MIDWNAECVSPIGGKRCKLRNGIITEEQTSFVKGRAHYCYLVGFMNNAMGKGEIWLDAKGQALGSENSRHIFDCIEVVD